MYLYLDPHQAPGFSLLLFLIFLHMETRLNRNELFPSVQWFKAQISGWWENFQVCN